MANPLRFSVETIKFIKKAAKQKRVDWLDQNREEYIEKVQGPLQHLASQLKSELAESAVGYHFPQKGIGRLKRSARRTQSYRHSAGAGVYKNWLAYTASVPSGSRFDHNPSLFFMINTEDKDDPVLLAGGLYMPSSKQMRAIRESIANDATPFDRLFKSKEFAKRFKGGFSDERVATRPPRGFDPTHPRMDWLKLQGFYVWRSYSMKDFSSAKFSKIIVDDCAQILRLNALLDQAIQGRKMEPTQVKKLKKGSVLENIETVSDRESQMDW